MSVYFLVALSRLIHPSNIVFVLSFRVVGEVVMAIGNVEVCFRIRAIAKFSYLVAKLRIHGLFPKVLSWPL